MSLPWVGGKPMGEGGSIKNLGLGRRTENAWSQVSNVESISFHSSHKTNAMIEILPMTQPSLAFIEAHRLNWTFLLDIIPHHILTFFHLDTEKENFTHPTFVKVFTKLKRSIFSAYFHSWKVILIIVHRLLFFELDTNTTRRQMAGDVPCLLK